jgi:hypothetical protein
LVPDWVLLQAQRLLEEVVLQLVLAPVFWPVD